MRDAVIKSVKELAERDRNVILMSGDLGYGVLDDFRRGLPQQYFNAGICEQSMASMAAGLALEGKQVYLYSIGNFPTLRCLEQIRNDICYHDADVKIIAVGGGFAYGSLGMSHHATEDIPVMRSLPNMRVFSPADAAEAKAVVREAAKIEHPCYIRLNKGGEPQIHKNDDALSGSGIERAVALREGEQVCLMATGAILAEALRAADILQKEGITSSVYSFPSIKPIDRDTVLRCAENFDTIYTLEEGNIAGGFGSAVSETITGRGLPVRVIRMGLNDIYSSVVGTQDYLRKVYGIDAVSVARRIQKTRSNCKEEADDILKTKGLL